MWESRMRFPSQAFLPGVICRPVASGAHRFGEYRWVIPFSFGQDRPCYLALTWTDFDLGRGTVSVTKTLEWRKGGWCFEDTKRERSRRMINLQNWVLALLRKLEAGSKPAERSPEVWSLRRTREVRFMSRSLSDGTSNPCFGQLVFRTYACTICATRQLPSLYPQGVAKDRERTTWARLGGIHARGLLTRTPSHAGHSRHEG